MGLRSAVAINVATMVGAGPFITLPLVVTALHGSVSAAAWVAGALIALCDGLVFAELASRYPRSGGTYAYLRAAFGPDGFGRLAAFLFAWQYLFSVPLILASGYIGFAQYAAYLVPALSGYGPTHAAAAVIGLLTLGALLRPIPSVARTALVLGGTAWLTLLALALAGLTHGRAPLAATLPPVFAPVALPALGAALVITLYDYAGYADVCALGDEVVAPARTIPRAIVLAVTLVAAAYVLLNLGVVAALAPAEIAQSTTVASLVAQRTFGAPFALAVTIAVLVTAFGSTYGLLLAAARVPYAAACDGDFLAAFARLHPTGRFPVVALVAIGLLALPASLLPLDAVISALTAGIVLIQGVGQIVALGVARRARPDAPFRIPLYPLPPLLALFGWLWLFASTSVAAMTFGLATLAAGAIVFLVGARRARRWPFAGAVLAVALTVAALASPATARAGVPSFGHAVVVQRSGAPRLLVDGRPFFFWGGAFFYERLPPERWRPSMLAMRALGANTLDLYVPWNWHEPADGAYDFDGRTDARRNLRAVLHLARELGFHLVVRPGPVIRNEWRNGGYPAWLLTRPDYAMPLHDVLEGRYPATATLQNAHSDDAAAEWLRNRTHLRYAASWLRRALAEFRPYADLVLAVQLDDDQGAYIDNQTYPAPHLHRYLDWLNAQVRAVVGPRTPVFINTYDLRVPSSLPYWTMGNWYQSDAYTVGDHDRVDLDLTTLLLATNGRGPLAQSEIQAGWLAAANDPQPRPADPRNTRLALTELLMLGAQGIIDFPMQDTYAQPGWEAPWANAAYTWDAALDARASAAAIAQPGTRGAETRAFGVLVRALAPLLLAAHRVVPVAVAYAEPVPRADSRPPEGAAAVVASLRATLGACVARTVPCDIVTPSTPPARLRGYRYIVLAPSVARAAPRFAAALAASQHRTRARVVATLPANIVPAMTVLTGPSGTLGAAGNWNAVETRLRYHEAEVVVPPHDVVLRVRDLPLATLGARGDARRVSSDDCNLWAANDASGLALSSSRGCAVRVGDGTTFVSVAVPAGRELRLPSLRSVPVRAPDAVPRAALRGDAVALAPRLDGVALDDGGEVPVGRAVVRVRRALPAFGREVVVLRNDRLRVLLDPAAGGRAFVLQAKGPQGRDAVWSFNAFDITGAWRDDVSRPIPPSTRDFIAPYTHDYPAGTFNRTYRLDVLASGRRAAVRLRYAMPDAEPRGLVFERIVSLEPFSSRIVVDERIDGRAGIERQHLVVRSSLPALARRDGGIAPRLAARSGGVAAYAHPFAFSVAWDPGGVTKASWTRFRSTGTLALTFAPGLHRTTYALAAARDEEAARRFAEAERRWLAANHATGR